MVTFPREDPTSAASCGGYLSTAGGPGVLVIAESGELSPHITDVVERFSAAGFTALAPDLSASGPTAVDHLSDAVDLLVERSGHRRVGAVGYGAGAGLALMLATRRPGDVRAVAPYYGGVVWTGGEPTWDQLEAKVVGEYAEFDETIPVAVAADLQERLRALGKDVTLNVHAGARAGFFDDSRPERFAAEPALEAWERTLTLLREELAPQE